LLDELAFGDKTPKMFLGGLNRLKTKLFLYLAHRGRETFQEALTDEPVNELPGFPGRGLG
jgi:hypothetical protein